MSCELLQDSSRALRSADSFGVRLAADELTHGANNDMPLCCFRYDSCKRERAYRLARLPARCASFVASA